MAAPPKDWRDKDFLRAHMDSCMQFFCREGIDPAGGFFHFFDAEGHVYDKTTRVLVTEARFIFSFAVAYDHLRKPEYLDAVRHGVASLSKGALRNAANGAYHWVVKDGHPTDSKIYTYALAQTLLAYGKAVGVGVDEARPFLEETWALLEEHMWLPQHGLYAEEADANWVVDPYRSESGNLHTCEALIAAYEVLLPPPAARPFRCTLRVISCGCRWAAVPCRAVPCRAVFRSERAALSAAARAGDT